MTPADRARLRPSIYEKFLDGETHRLAAHRSSVSEKAAIVAIRAACKRRGLRFVCERIGRYYYVAALRTP